MTGTISSIITVLITLFFVSGCKSVIERQDVRPKVLRDVRQDVRPVGSEEFHMESERPAVAGR